ncbi:MAG: hypothetical protein CHACPFDD_01736 [Phycisphaerae bacterium]|nr:hypothetical protein [Phycisphaerae bacterium]
MTRALLGSLLGFWMVSDGLIHTTDTPDALLTVAERSDYRATARYAEVVDLLNRLARQSPLVRRSSLGVTFEGREIPMLIVADPPVESPADLRHTAGPDARLVVLAIGNIHAGEVDGKEALPMVVRELLATPHHPLLRDVVLLVAPIYNADGNERVSRDNRPGQVGPEEGMGIRENAQGLDLNRDFIKLEAPETRALVDVLKRWDPAIFIDTHTTNGCYHRYVITYETPKTPAGNQQLIEFARDEMMPEVSRGMLARYGVPSFVYGDFNRAHTRWDTYPCHARFGTSYVGLRNRISVLSEGYSYATYEQRVLGTRDFVKSILEYAAANKDRIRRLLADVDAATIAAGRAPDPAERVALQTEATAAPHRAVAAGYVEETRDGRVVSTGVPKDYEVELWTHFRGTLAVARPTGYYVPPSLEVVIDKLRQHGVAFELLTSPRDADVEVYRVDAVKSAAEPFQNHRLSTVQVTPRRERREIQAGWAFVTTAQPLGSLAVYLLEPRCEDGLTAWNYVDEHLAPGRDFPILRAAP